MFSVGEEVSFRISKSFSKMEQLDLKRISGKVVSVSANAVVIELSPGDEIWVPFWAIHARDCEYGTYI